MAIVNSRKQSRAGLRAMENISRQNLTAQAEAREKGLGAGLGASTGPDQNILMGAGSQRATRNRESYGHFRSWVYVCVDAIARRIAGQACGAGEIENAEANQERGARFAQKAGTGGGLIYPHHRAKTIPPPAYKYIGEGQQLSVFEQHRSMDLLSRPNGIQRKFEFLYMSAANLLLTGECYWVGTGPDEEDPESRGEVWAVPTSWMTPIHDGGLFTGYKMQVSGQAIPQDIPPEMVARTYFADPSDLKSAYSPLRAILQAIRVDDYIQESQEQMFERGINPNLIVTVGRVRGEDGSLTDRRPVLSGGNRRQIIRAVREIWNQTVSTGDPAILDGLIESVHKLHNTPQEMDWPTSGEIVKKRVMQGYKVNPIVVGEVTAGNRAQAVEAEKNFCSNAVNPLVAALSETMTDFVGPMYTEPERLVLWIEECEPIDADQELKQWTEARKNDDVTRDEFRGHILGLPPMEERDDEAKLLNQQGGIQGISAVLKQVSLREITPEQASLTLQTTLRLDVDTADEIAGVGQELPELPPPPEPPPQDDDEDDEIVDEDEQDNDDEDNEDNDDEPPAEESRAIASPRKAVQEIVLKTGAKIEGRWSHAMARHFRRSVRDCTAKIAKLNIEPQPDNAEVQAAVIVAKTFDYEAALADTYEICIPHYAKAVTAGLFDEIRLLAAVNKAEDLHGTKTTAEDVIAEYDLELPEGVSPGEAPVWFREAMEDQLTETFQRDYWTRIDEVTSDDIQGTLSTGLSEGHSIRRIAATINASYGAAYSIARATLVARTEMTGAMNAGHEAGIAGTAAETGLAMGKEWVSVLGNTTRRSHYDADGEQTATPDGLFTVGGAQTPYPGHGGLPARERCNCQCTIISSLVMDALQEPDATTDVTETDTAALDAMPVKDVVNGHKGLEAKQKKMAALGVKLDKELEETQLLLEAQENLISGKERTRKHIMENGLLINEETDTWAPQSVTDLVAEDMYQELRKDRNQLWEIRKRRHKLRDKQRADAMKVVRVPTKQRVKMKTTKVGPKALKESPSLKTWRDDQEDGGLLRSTGKFTPYQNANIKEARDFFQKSVAVRPDMTADQLEQLADIRAHSPERKTRAFYMQRSGGPFKGINCDPADLVDVYVHEMGHHMEYQLPGVQKRANEFVEYRVAKAGRPNRKMQQVFPAHKYKDHEIGNEDDFVKAFDQKWTAGKSYPPGLTWNTTDKATGKALNSAMYTAKTYGSRNATEIVSMGTQLLYEDPVGFARRDPEYFKFIVGVLDGTIR